ncbi:MAG TPA: D-alanyl-D-alanine carboxypeptidase/D-alanyl-D-alanine-endopeptidase [Acidobacteriaceae bacterium]|jgi:D-alanyl-D-alanine carboxypeptidase/D-alanyl-D-alanine-endopeptidase (penicillin-binding protein 4)
MFLPLRSALALALTGTAVALAQTAQPPVEPTPVAHAAFPTGAATPLGAQIEGLLADPKVARAHWGIAVTEMDGTPIYGLDEGKLFRPASNAKIFTTATAMALIGPETRVTTAVEGPLGSRGSKVLDGNLRLVGAGDANLSARQIPYMSPAERKRAAQTGAPSPKPEPLRYLTELADGLVQEGVTRIRGAVVGDDSLWPSEPYAADWTIDDALWGYGAPVSALTINDNQIALRVSPGAKEGGPANVTLDPASPSYYNLDTKGLHTGPAKSGNHVSFERNPGSRTLRLWGTLGLDSPADDEEIAIEDPAEYAAMALRQILIAKGVRVDGPARAEHRLQTETAGFTKQVNTLLPKLPTEPLNAGISRLLTGRQSCSDACPVRVEHVSPSMTEDVTVTMKVSQNLHAELLLRRLGKAFGEDGTSAQGARVVRQFLLNAGLDGDDFVFYDGSGLSAHDLIAPRAAAQLLSFAAKQPWFAPWKSGLPVGGEDGTLASRFPSAPLKDHLFAKTGTLSETRALSGYLDCASGKVVIFSIIVDNHTPVTSDDRAAMDKIVAAIAASE